MQKFYKLFLILVLFTATISAQPTLTAPADNATGLSVTPTFTWDVYAGATTYRIQIFDVTTVTTLFVEAGGLASTSYVPVTPLEPGKKYIWQVRANNSGYSAPFTFYTKPLPPTLTAPVNNSTVANLLPIFNWSAVNFATSYRIQISKGANFTTTVVNQANLLAPVYVTTAELEPGTKYIWRVKANNSDYADRFTFYTRPAAPELVFPANNSVKNSIVPTFDWNPVTGNGTIVYTLEIAEDAAFTQNLVVISGLTATEFAYAQPLYKLTNDRDYYYRVKAADDHGESDYSTAFKFRTVIEIKPALSHPANGEEIFTNPCLFTWHLNQVAEGITYDFEISLNADMTSPVILHSNLTDITLEQLLDGLPGNTSIYWRVTSKAGVNIVSSFSAINSFKIQAPGFVALVPQVSYPIGNPTVYSNTQFLYWYLLGNGTGLTYNVFINTDNDFTGLPNETGITDLFYEAKNLLPGTTYYWKVQSTNGTEVSAFSALGQFTTIENTTSVSPTLTYPIENTTIYSINPILYWYVGVNTTGFTYELQYGTDNTFATATTVTSPNMFKQIMGLTTGTTYYWRVRSFNGTTYSAWSATESFNVYGAILSLVPTPFSPDNGATIYTVDPTLYWYMENGAENLSYEVEYNTTNTFTGAPTVSGLLEKELELTGLIRGMTYYWKVRSNNGSTVSNWSATQSFTVFGIGGSPVPVLSWPIGGVAVYNGDQNLIWYINGNSTGLTYDVRISSNGVFTGAPAFENLTETTVELTNLHLGDLVYWQVRSKNGGVYSAWSAVEYFVVYSESAALMPISGNPANGVVINTTEPVLSWILPVQNNTLSYELEISNSPEMDNPTVVNGLNSTFTEVSIDNNANYYWRVRSINSDGQYSNYSAVASFSTGDVPTTVETEELVPTEYFMSQNYPNPFNPTTNIKFGIPNAGMVKVVIYNMLGQEVKTLVNQDLNAGTYNLTWNGENELGIKVSSGAYLYRITSGNFIETKKLMLIK